MSDQPLDLDAVRHRYETARARAAEGHEAGPFCQSSHDVPALVGEVERLREALTKLRVEHLYVDDCWYSCPKSIEGCCDDSKGDDCNCGADAHNAVIDAALGSGRGET